MISRLISRVINWFVRAAPTIRVVERQMDGCMAHYCSREDYGTVIGHDSRLLLGFSDTKKVPWWLIRWDGDREDQWYPGMFFKYTDDDGTWVREC